MSSRRISRSGQLKGQAMYTDGYDDKGEYYSGECEEDEMPATERELAEDAQWKVIQKNTFTRWTNEHLKQANKSIADLEFDLSDGLRLCALIEVLSGKKFRRINKRPNFRSQKLENVTTALKLLEEDEGIKIVNIDSTDIVDSKLKLILGLIWTLILHYSISMPMWEGEEDMPVGDAKEGPTPKQRLLIWVQNKLPDRPIRNFTTDWNDGKAIGALVDAVGPGLCPDWEDWDPSKGKKNAAEAMDLAEEWLDVPQLIRPEEMVNPKVDELSMMTYLSQFPNAKLKPGAPLRPRTNPARVRAYGPGLEPQGVCALAPAKFTIETFSAGRGDVVVQVTNPDGDVEECECVFNDDRNLTYSCQYVPSMEGEYTIKITFAGKEIPKSPYKVSVEGSAGDADKVTAAGPGLENTGVQCGKKTNFEVFTAGAGIGIVEVVIVDGHGRKDSVKPRISKSSDTTYYVEYMASETGRYSVHIYFAGKEIPLSPYTVNVGAPVEPKKAYATGRGIQAKGVRVKDVAEIKVHTENAGQAELTGTLVGPAGGSDLSDSSSSSDEEDSKRTGREEPLRFKKIDANTYETSYTPTQPGSYTVNLMYGGSHISKSPFKVNVGPYKESRIRAYGPGLEGGVVGKPADFIVETNGETGALGFAIEGPSEAKIDCSDNGDGSADVHYMPTAPGEYAVHVLCDNEDIPNSPFMANIAPAMPCRSDLLSPDHVDTTNAAPGAAPGDEVSESLISPEAAQHAHSALPYDYEADEVVVSGPGLQKNGVIQGQPAKFTVDTRKAGSAPLKIYGEDVKGAPINIKIQDNKNGTYDCQYTPKEPIKHTVIVTYGGINVPKSPFRVYVEEPAMPEKVRVFGPGIENGVTLGQPTHFFVDCTEAGPGDVAISLTDDKGVDVPVDADDNGEGLFRIEYQPKTIGTYTVNVIFADKEIPSSPYKVKIEPDIDVSGVKVVGLEPKVAINKVTNFKVTYNTKVRKLNVSVIIRSPSGKVLNPLIKSNYDGCNVSFAPRERGTYTIEVYANSKPIPGSAFSTEAEGEPVEEEKIRPQPGKINFAKPKDEEKPGLGKRGKFGRKPADEEPDWMNAQLKPWQKAKPKPGAIKVTGDGLTKGKTNKPCKFLVDTSAVGPGRVTYDMRGPSKPHMTSKDAGPNKLEVSYVPSQPGEYTLDIMFKGAHVGGSPYKPVIERSASDEPTKGVKVYGDGIVSGTEKIVAKFIVDTSDVGPGKLGFDVKGPGKPVVTTKSIDTNKCEVSYTPPQPGEYSIEVTYNGTVVPGSPFKPMIKPGKADIKAQKVKVYGDGLKTGQSNQPAKFIVDTSASGPGKLGFDVKGPGQAPVTSKSAGFNKCEVTYTPSQPGEYSIDVTYNGTSVPDSPFKPTIQPQSDDKACKVKVYGDGLKTGQANQPAKFIVDTSASGPGKLGFDVKGPGQAPVTSKSAGFNKCEVTYMPSQPGEYSIDVTYNGTSVPDSPFKPTIQPQSDDKACKVKVYGDGLKTGQANQPAKFIVDTSASGPGKLGFDVKGPSHAPVTTKSAGLNKCEVTYMPSQPGEYSIDVTYNGTSVPNSPFKPTIQSQGDDIASKVKIYGDGLTIGTANQPAKFIVDTSVSGPGKLGFDVKGPAKAPVTTKNVGFNKCEATYMPTKSGEYSIEVTYNGSPVPGSPFRPVIQGIQMDEKAKKVKVYGDGLKTGKVNSLAKFTVDTTLSGPGKLGFDIQGPEKPVITTKDVGFNKCEVSYVPTRVGEYCIDVTYNGTSVPDSPFKPSIQPVQETDKASNVKVYGDGITKGKVNQVAKFMVDTSASGPGKLKCDVQGPAKTEVVTQSAGVNKYEVSYTPTVVGEYNVNVIYDGTAVPGSPFKPHIEMATVDVKASKVKVYGDGITAGKANQVAKFIVDTSASGPGKLGFDIQGPARAVMTTKDVGFNKCEVSYTPTTAGEYCVDVTYNGTSVPGSPFKPIIKTGAADDKASKVKVSGTGLTTGKANQVAKFVVDTSASGPGKLDFNIQGPSKPDLMTKKAGFSKYEVAYTPTHVGEYCLDVTYNGNPVPGSPFKPSIEPGTEDKKADKVKVYGDGITAGQANQTAKFIVDTSASGPGKLGFDIRGPSKPTVTTRDVGVNKCEVSYTPSQAGEYSVAVTYDGFSVPGSPFKPTVKVAQIDDKASKVRVYGNGIESAKTNQPSTFIVDTSVSGPGKLAFNIQGPAKAELTTKPAGFNKCEVSYTPTVIGEYSLDVTYNGNPVPGSPFTPTVTVGETDEKASKVKVYGEGITIGKANQPSKFIVDTSTSGPGKLGFDVKGPGKAEIKTAEIGPNQCEVSYIATQVGEYSIGVTYNDSPVPGSPFKPNVKPAMADEKASKVKVYGDGISAGKPLEVSKFIVDTSISGPGVLDFKIDGPGNAELKTKKVGFNKTEVSYTPNLVGEYSIDVTYNGTSVPGCPFKPVIESSETVEKAAKVKVYGSGLSNGTVDQPTSFVVDTSESGPGALSFDVKGPSKAQLTTKSLAVDKCEVTYMPTLVGDYEIGVLFDNSPVIGSPFRSSVDYAAKQPLASRVKVSGDGIEKVQVNQTARFVVDTSEEGPGNLSFDIQGPSKADVTTRSISPTKCEVSYTPTQVGEYAIDISYNGLPVAGAPFKCTVQELPTKQAANKVKVTGDGVKHAAVNKTTSFIVDTSAEGPGKLAFGVRGPSKAVLTTKSISPDKCEVSYTPTKVGDYTIDVTYNGQSVSGAPFMCKVTEPVEEAVVSEEAPEIQSSIPITAEQKVTVKGDGVTVGKVNTLSSFIVDTSVSGPGQLNCNIKGPSEAKLQTRQIDNTKCEISYLPTKTGEYLIDVLFNSKPIPGSPFRSAIVGFDGPDLEPDVIKGVKLSGKGISAGTVGQPSTFLVDTSVIGPGELSFEMKGPSQSQLMVSDLKRGLSEVSYVATQPGRYDLMIFYNGKQISSQPYSVQVDQPAHMQPSEIVPEKVVEEFCEVTRLSICDKKGGTGSINTPYSFEIDTAKAAPGKLAFNMQAPCECTINAYPIDKTRYEVRFLPTKPGTYQVEVTHNGKVVLGRPIIFKVDSQSLSAEQTREKVVQSSMFADSDVNMSPRRMQTDMIGESAHVMETITPKESNVQESHASPQQTLPESYRNVEETITLGESVQNSHTAPQKLLPQSYDKVDTMTQETITLSESTLLENTTREGHTLPQRPQSESDENIEETIMLTKSIQKSHASPQRTLPQSLENVEETMMLRESVDSHATSQNPLPQSYEKVDTITQETITLSESTQPQYEVPAKQSELALDDAYTVDLPSGSRSETTIAKTIILSESDILEGSSSSVEPQSDNQTDVTLVEDRAFNVLSSEAPSITQADTTTIEKTVVLSDSSVETSEVLSTKQKLVESTNFSVESTSFGASDTTIEKTVILSDSTVEESDVSSTQVHNVLLESLPSDSTSTDAIETISLSKSNVGESAVSLTRPLSIPHTGAVEETITLSQSTLTEDGRFSNKPIAEDFQMEEVEASFNLSQFVSSDQEKSDVVEIDDVEATFTISDESVVEESFSSTRSTRGRMKTADAERMTSETQLQAPVPVPTQSKISADSIVQVLSAEERPTVSGPAALVKVEGKCLERATLNKTEVIYVDLRDAGAGKLGFFAKGPSEPDLVAKNVGNSRYEVTFKPKMLGTYMLEIKFNGQHIAGSPFFTHATSNPNLDISRLRVDKIRQSEVFLDSTSEFVVDASSVTPDGEGQVKAIVTNPSGTKNDTIVTNNNNGTYTVAYAPFEEGPHKIDVSYEGLPIPGSPLEISAQPGNDPSRVKAYGPGLEKGYTKQPQQFTIATKGAGRGGLSLAVEGPSKAEVKCTDNHDGTCTVDYTPLKPGDYDIIIKFDDQDIPGSPFKVPVEDIVDVSKVRLHGPGVNDEGVRATVPTTFTVDCTDAGKSTKGAPVITLDDGKEVKELECEEVDDNIYQCSYVPVEEGVCKLGVVYNNEQVPGSPFEQKVLPAHDASKVKASGPGLEDGVPASLPTTFDIDTSDAGVADLDIAIQAPDGRYLRPSITDNKDATVTVNYTPEEVGKYTAKVKYGDDPIPGSPFEVNTKPSGDASKCLITDSKKRVVVDEECVVTVDTADAGMGNITCRIRTPSDTDADIDIVDNNDGTVSIYYTPRTPGTYGISIKFGGVPIPEGDYEVEALPDDQVPVDEADIMPVQKVKEFQSAPPSSTMPNLNMFHPVDFVIPVGPIFAYVFAEVEAPSGQRSPVKVLDNGDGTVTINYQPTEVGLHNLHVSYNEEPLEGSPYQFYVDAVDSSAVAAYGPGLSYGVAGEPCTFTIDTKNAGAGPSKAPVQISHAGRGVFTAKYTAKTPGVYSIRVLAGGKDIVGSPFRCHMGGGLSLAVEGPSKAEIACQDNDDGTCTVNYYPTEPGLYNIVVKFDDEHILGSPFTSYIAGEASKEKAQLSMGQASEFSLSVDEYDINSLEADIISPSGKTEPCLLKKLPNGHLGISFTPHETGTHMVNVYKDGEHIPNSPFKINVTRNEVGHADKVKVYGDALSYGTANEDNEFYVDTREAGYGGLSLSVEGPSKADIDCKDKPDGTTAVTYKPTQAGTYVISIKFADEHVPGSPFNCKVGGVSTSKEEARITSHEKGADVTHVGSVCELSLKVPGSDPMEMLASVTSPSGVSELCDIMDSTEDHYTIKFVPKEMGTHTVCVKHKGLNIPGSPFQFTVGPITEGGAHKVKASGPGLERGEVGISNEFNIYTREAGSGGLMISVEGPSKADIKFEDKHDGSSTVSYKCTDPGEYVVSIRFNDEHIPDSPFRVPVVPSSGDARKITVQSLKQKGLEIGKPAAFTCVYNGAKGHLSAKVVAPSGAEDEALIQALDDTNAHFAVRFIPRENGIHYVHVKLDGAHIKGSPFRVIVGDSIPDPGLVMARGEGLVKADTAKVNKFTVHTVGAGASTLAVTIDGPSKVKLDAKEVGDGYEFSYTPSAPGVYYVTIKYGGNTHIAGSPFKVNCTGSGKPSGKPESAHCVIDTKVISEADAARALPKFNSDGSKVTSKGLGLNKAFVNKKAQFTVDTSTAGQNMLFVGMVGPANAPPVDEILIKHASRNQYNVSYSVKQKGKYLLLVKWGDDHIPGSPFNIEVV